ncbi:hypothetical protein ACTMTJ_34430 [Phytohabitans sp. LJ34]|uniref:hypothetical protein n=1 Tax=Phytohabitans sp. LJ34 TaxID=3452217 RepID=UPI003F8A16BD
MAGRDVVLWSVDDTVLDDGERRRPDRITDVFYRSHRPAPGSLVLGLSWAAADQTEPPSVRVVGVARSSQQIATGKDRSLITPLLHIDPVPFDHVQKRLPVAMQRRLDFGNRAPNPLAPTRLSPQLGAAVVAVLRGLSPATARWLDALVESGTPIGGDRGARLREERDAVSLAIDIADMSAPEGLLLPSTAPVDVTAPFGATFNPLFVIDSEDDLLAEDLRRFDPRSVLRLRSASVARFTSDRFALTVMNVNRKPLEQVLGVDLVYWDELAQIFTLVQYKRLSRRPGGPETARWAYTNREDLRQQLGRMNLGPQEPVNSADWRLASSPFWFKFVRAEDFTAGDRFVLKGMYVPADYLSLAMADGSLRTGPRTGFEITYANVRYLPREPFVELVRRGFAGTTRSATEAVLEIIRELSTANEVVLAMKTPIGEHEARNSGRGASPYSF